MPCSPLHDLDAVLRRNPIRGSRGTCCSHAFAITVARMPRCTCQAIVLTTGGLCKSAGYQEGIWYHTTGVMAIFVDQNSEVFLAVVRELAGHLRRTEPVCF